MTKELRRLIDRLQDHDDSVGEAQHGRTITKGLDALWSGEAGRIEKALVLCRNDIELLEADL